MDASAQTQAPTLTWLGSMHEGIPVSHANLDACIEFYTKVLGLKLLKRPKALDDIGRGAWLGDADDKVQFHLIATERDFKPGPGTKYSATGRHTAIPDRRIPPCSCSARRIRRYRRNCARCRR